MRRIRVIKTWRLFNDSRIGIHLLNPTKQEVTQARTDARAKGFDRVFIHLSQSQIRNRKMIPN